VQNNVKVLEPLMLQHPKLLFHFHAGNKTKLRFFPYGSYCFLLCIYHTRTAGYLLRVQLSMPVQTRFRFTLVLTFVTREPPRSFTGGVFKQCVLVQTLFHFGPVLTTETVQPFSTIRFMASRVTLKVVFPFCFVWAVLAFKPRLVI
jgi:hypothetical protein